MEQRFFLIIAANTAQMLFADRVLKAEGINTQLVPAPPESGTVCAIAVKISQDDVEAAKRLIAVNSVEVTHILEDKRMKLQGLLDEKLAQGITEDFLRILERIESGQELDRSDILYLLSTQREKEINTIFSAADRIRKETVGDAVEIRGAIEFSNYCRKDCSYCGIGSSNKCVKRYSMSEEEIMEAVHSVKAMGMKTVILQSGEDSRWDTPRLVRLVERIRNETGMKITLSVGEKSREEYEQLRNAGAVNFLLKIETTNRDLFARLHPDDDYDHRLQCSLWLKELGYLNGSGNIIGLPGQTLDDIAGDILYFKEMGINMIGIGPFIPAEGSRLENHPTGDIDLTLRVVAVTRIVCKRVYIPSTTALASLDKDAQVKALQAGANTIMLINTPERYRKSYNIYNNKNMVDMASAAYAAEKAGRPLPSYIVWQAVNPGHECIVG
ncbi:iron-only hydrogenase maturation protein HydE [Anaerobacterium chartisolvens]|uniref:Iron-only hydrogenase maturation protein HydE n=1 Tax=Anaerobacterium chartisolvens TaxID=1297424 RepID=A0A369AXQ4_9FIRM|nr:[FeFe] hydrogenase H-cluster radical SAM maturase HydE [Anaerobacterium chartisolvens]RCX13865.1 iron-only hydrogenase maturation protein HydE [Anaerobacterium chartisolvens]